MLIARRRPPGAATGPDLVVAIAGGGRDRARLERLAAAARRARPVPRPRPRRRPARRSTAAPTCSPCCAATAGAASSRRASASCSSRRPLPACPRSRATAAARPRRWSTARPAWWCDQPEDTGGRGRRPRPAARRSGAALPARRRGPAAGRAGVHLRPPGGPPRGGVARPGIIVSVPGRRLIQCSLIGTALFTVVSVVAVSSGTGPACGRRRRPGAVRRRLHDVPRRLRHRHRSQPRTTRSASASCTSSRTGWHPTPSACGCWAPSPSRAWWPSPAASVRPFTPPPSACWCPCSASA